MKTIHKTIVATIISLSLCGTANADWRSDKFGESLEKVKKNNPHAISVSDNIEEQREFIVMKNDKVLLHEPDYDIDGMKFDVRFLFDSDNKLNGIMLCGDGIYYDRALTLLSGKYGRPSTISFGNMPDATWADQTKKMQIRLIRIFYTLIRYSPQTDRL
ncbi:hypothetical protein [Gluconobacter sp. Gdi]|uniref:hypothetical protein n=1 Tax=Gluconobacter sp. Gdi TaxID=2691888 RepID=UPI00174F859C|nr:hypothetical protein [Gluconobacter sp. Gdi]GFE98076.1 hypothetical protein DmGdi_31490 [Gluconobacter sp. Gdi]